MAFLPPTGDPYHLAPEWLSWTPPGGNRENGLLTPSFWRDGKPLCPGSHWPVSSGIVSLGPPLHPCSLLAPRAILDATTLPLYHPWVPGPQ